MRAPLVAGDITRADLVTMDPFDNTVVLFKATGAQIKDILARHAPYVSGIRYRLVDGRLEEATIGGQPIDDGRIYTGATNSYFRGVCARRASRRKHGPHAARRRDRVSEGEGHAWRRCTTGGVSSSAGGAGAGDNQRGARRRTPPCRGAPVEAGGRHQDERCEHRAGRAAGDIGGIERGRRAARRGPATEPGARCEGRSRRPRRQPPAARWCPTRPDVAGTRRSAPSAASEVPSAGNGIARAPRSQVSRAPARRGPPAAYPAALIPAMKHVSSHPTC